MLVLQPCLCCSRSPLGRTQHRICAQRSMKCAMVTETPRCAWRVYMVRRCGTLSSGTGCTQGSAGRVTSRCFWTVALTGRTGRAAPHERTVLHQGRRGSDSEIPCRDASTNRRECIELCRYVDEQGPPQRDRSRIRDRVADKEQNKHFRKKVEDRTQRGRKNRRDRDREPQFRSHTRSHNRLHKRCQGLSEDQHAS